MLVETTPNSTEEDNAMRKLFSDLKNGCMLIYHNFQTIIGNCLQNQSLVIPSEETNNGPNTGSRGHTGDGLRVKGGPAISGQT